MSVALMGPIELLMIMLMGGSVPVVMPPLPADAGMMSVAPSECLFYTSWYGIDDPQQGSGNSTEALMAEPQVQQFLQMIGRGIESMLASEDAPRDMREGAAIFLPLIKDLYQRPATLYVSDVELSAVGASVDAAIVVHCGDRREALVGHMQKIEALFASSTNMPVNEIQRSGVAFRKFMLPPEAPEIGWGVSGDYLIFSVGSEVFDGVIQRTSAKPGPAPWLKEMHASLDVARPGFVQYVNVAKVIESVTMLMPFGADEVHATIQHLGLNSISHMATIQGYDADNVVSKTQIATTGPPQGALQLLAGEPLSPSDLQDIPADANLAFALKMDLNAKADQLVRLAGAIDPNAGAELERGMAELSREAGFDIREELLDPLGGVFRVYNSPGSGGLIVSGLTMVADVDDHARLHATHERILANMRRSFKHYGEGVGLSTLDFEGMSVHTLSLGTETPIAPSWCLTENRVVIGLYPQSVKAFLSRDSAEPSLADNPQIQAAFAGDDPPYMVSYQDTQDLMRTLYPLVQMVTPILASELRRDGFEFDIAALPSANAILPHMTPGVTTCTVTSDGLIFESQQSVPGLSALPVLAVLGIGVVANTEEGIIDLGPAYPEAQNNLRQIAIAMHNHHDVNGRLPAAVNANANGKPLLSWRVHLLPYLEQQALYEQFRLDEPWDSEHNKTLIVQMPEVFNSPGGAELDEGMTSIVVPTGDETIFPIGGGGPGKGLSLSSIRDGTSNTVMIVEAAPENAVIWTKPDDWRFNADNPTKGLVGHRHGGFLAAFADAHVAVISAIVPAEMVKAIFTRDGAEQVDASMLEDGRAGDFDRAVPPPVFYDGGGVKAVDLIFVGG